jgi:hypothetical protein
MYSTGGSQFLNYASVKQLYYQEYLTGSLMNSSSYWNDSLQSTAASGSFDNDYRYFPTSASAQISTIKIPRTVFGEQIARRSFIITGSTYRLIDDGNGNLIDTYTTGSKNYTTYGASYGVYGVRLYNTGYDVNGNGSYLSWNTSIIGGTYAGTFWANPSSATTDGRLNNAGFWSAESPNSLAKGTLNFTASVATTNTYYLGIGCDNKISIYLDNELILFQNTNVENYLYWNIYPITLTSGSHDFKLLGINNDDNPSGGTTPGLMGIEIYNNTSTQISASITAAPLGSSIPAGINLVYSSKDNLNKAIFAKDLHVGNILYSQGVVIITDEDYQNALIP